MKKKILAALLACVVVTGLTACSNNVDAETLARIAGNNTNPAGSTGNAGNTGNASPNNGTNNNNNKSGTHAYNWHGFEGTYSGDWSNNQPNGNGTFTSTNYKISGNWQNGDLNGQGEYNYSSENTTIYRKGTFSNTKLNGHGYSKKTAPTTKGIMGEWEEEGEFFDNELSGQGKRTAKTKNETQICTGTFYSGKFTDGSVTLKKNGQTFKGTCTNGDITYKIN